MLRLIIHKMTHNDDGSTDFTGSVVCDCGAESDRTITVAKGAVGQRIRCHDCHHSTHLYLPDQSNAANQYHDADDVGRVLDIVGRIAQQQREIADLRVEVARLSIAAAVGRDIVQYLASINDSTGQLRRAVSMWQAMAEAMKDDEPCEPKS